MNVNDIIRGTEIGVGWFPDVFLAWVQSVT